MTDFTSDLVSLKSSEIPCRSWFFSHKAMPLPTHCPRRVLGHPRPLSSSPRLHLHILRSTGSTSTRREIGGEKSGWFVWLVCLVCLFVHVFSTSSSTISSFFSCNDACSFLLSSQLFPALEDACAVRPENEVSRRRDQFFSKQAAKK